MSRSFADGDVHELSMTKEPRRPFRNHRRSSTGDFYPRIAATRPPPQSPTSSPDPTPRWTRRLPVTYLSVSVDLSSRRLTRRCLRPDQSNPTLHRYQLHVVCRHHASTLRASTPAAWRCCHCLWWAGNHNNTLDKPTCRNHWLLYFCSVHCFITFTGKYNFKTVYHTIF